MMSPTILIATTEAHLNGSYLAESIVPAIIEDVELACLVKVLR